MAAWKEIIPDGEAAELEALAARLRARQKENPEKGRALHRKQHVGLSAELATLPDLPAWARAGIFAEPKTYRAYVRFSNGGPDARSDKAPDVRGMAVKIVGVPGKKLIKGLEDANTQDFLGILTPSIAFRTPSEFVGVVLAATGSPLLLLPRMIGALGFRIFTVLPQLQAGLKVKVPSLATQTFFSALPIRWGDTAAKFSFAPRDPKELPVDVTASVPLDENDPGRYAADIAARLAKGSLAFDLRAQPFENEETTPIENPTIEWKTPWVTVGTLSIPSQDPGSDSGKKLAAFVSSLSFDPWHAPEDFRPLGAMMRARASAYRESVLERGAAAEPDGTESF